MHKQCLFLLISLFSISLSAQSVIPMDSSIRYGKLENGLTYYIRSNKQLENRADFYIAQNVGAILEEDYQNGLAHFLEHMAFNGTKNFPGKGIINYMESIGAQFGTNINAYTSLDETVYMLRSIPVHRAGIVDSALLILHDWSSFISLEAEEIDKERGVILEEWRTGAHANRRMWKESNKQKYPGSQYAKRDIIGDTAIINNFMHETLRDYYKKWYRPDLQALIIVGDISVDTVEMSIKKLFADIPAPVSRAPRPIYSIPNNASPIVSIVTDPEAKVSRLGIEYKHEPLADTFKKTTGYYTKLLINSLLGRMIESRFEEISADPTASFVGGYAEYGAIDRSKDAFQVMVVAKDGQEKQAFNAMLTEVQRLKKHGFLDTELERAKKELLAYYEKLYNERTNTKNANYVQEYIGHFLELEPIPSIEWEYERAPQYFNDSISLLVINQTLQNYITSNNIVVDISGPEKQKAQLPDKSMVLSSLNTIANTEVTPYSETTVNKTLLQKKLKAGSLVSEKAMESLQANELLLSNGIRIITKETTLKNDEILVACFSEGGYSLVKKVTDLPSAFFATNIVENNGLGAFSKIELSKHLAGKIATISPYISTYSEGFSGSSSVKDLETLLQLIHLYFSSPRKDDDAFDALMNKYKTVLINAETDPRKTFSDSINFLSANKHPLAGLITMATLEKVSQKTALNIFKQRFANPADFTFVFVGNIHKDSLLHLATKYLGSLKTSKKKEQWKDHYMRFPKGVQLSDFEKAMQVAKTSIYLQFNGEMAYSLSQKTHMDALADILDLRFTETIREDEGGTYGVRVKGSVSKTPIEEADLSIQFDTDKEKKDRLIDLIYNELETIQTNGPREADLQKVKLNLLKQHQENLEENGWWLKAISLYEKDKINLAADYTDAVNTLSVKSIQEFLKALLIQQNKLEIFMNPKQ